VSATSFATGDGAAAETIPAASVTYIPGPAAASGPGMFAAGDHVTLDPGGTAYALTASTGSGQTSASWHPTLTIRLRPGLVAGVYAGTVTHSVS
jgi:hypothetical protein